MIHFQILMKSATLQTKVHVNVLLPEAFDSHEVRELVPLYPLDKKFKVLTLLHGAWDDSSCWIRRTNIEKIADEKGFAVVMPEVGNSFYTNMKHGSRWYTFITEELPQAMCRNFPLSSKKEDNFLCGLSMGGYGTMMIGFNHPERYGALASMSGALDMKAQIEEKLKGESTEITERLDLENIWDGVEDFVNTPSDILWLMEQAKKEGKKIPPLFQVVGTEDFLYEENQNFKKKAEELGFDLHYEELPGGHEWRIWQTYLPKIVDWMGL